VFTRKVATDVSYLACAKVLLDAGDVIYPAFATHNATTIGQVKALAKGRAFEFQRLHGMGEELYEELGKLESAIGDPRTPVRIYAPVGSHKELLAYLVRRLLENGANSSFVNRIADEHVSLDELVRDPVAELAGLEPKRNPKIILPRDVFGTSRRNSAGVDLADPLVREPLLERLEALAARTWTARPTLGSGQRVQSLRRTIGASKSALPSTPALKMSIAWCMLHTSRSRAGMRSVEMRGRSCSIAPLTCSKSIARSCSRCASAKAAKRCPTRYSKSARRSTSSASMRPKRGVSSLCRSRSRGRPVSRTS
jgi:hypothetical protein